MIDDWHPAVVVRRCTELLDVVHVLLTASVRL